MAQNVTVAGASYSGVPAVNLPKTGGGTATFYDEGSLPDMTGADGTNAGAHGFVPAPAASDNVKFLRGDGSWATALTSYTETDPTVPSWAKAASKPTYVIQPLSSVYTLWSNSSSSSTFNAQTISGTNINLVTKRPIIVFLRIQCATDVTDEGIYIAPYLWDETANNRYYCLFGNQCSVASTYIYSRVITSSFRVTMTTGAWTMTFGDGYRGTTKNNKYCIPKNVYALPCEAV